jgi:hypothetical protein
VHGMILSIYIDHSNIGSHSPSSTWAPRGICLTAASDAAFTETMGTLTVHRTSSRLVWRGTRKIRMAAREERTGRAQSWHSEPVHQQALYTSVT